MNPNVCERRGCFVRKEDDGRLTVVDYPTWTCAKYGKFTKNQNEPIEDGKPAEKTFDAEDEMRRFCEDENYVICRGPHDKKPDERPRRSEDDDEIFE